MATEYKILADKEDAIVLHNGYAPKSFQARNGFSAYDLAERFVATGARMNAVGEVAELFRTGHPSNCADVHHPRAKEVAAEAHTTLTEVRRLLDKVIEMSDIEVAVYKRTEQGA